MACTALLVSDGKRDRCLATALRSAASPSRPQRVAKTCVTATTPMAAAGIAPAAGACGGGGGAAARRRRVQLAVGQGGRAVGSGGGPAGLQLRRQEHRGGRREGCAQMKPPQRLHVARRRTAHMRCLPRTDEHATRRPLPDAPPLRATVCVAGYRQGNEELPRPPATRSVTEFRPPGTCRQGDRVAWHANVQLRFQPHNPPSPCHWQAQCRPVRSLLP